MKKILFLVMFLVSGACYSDVLLVRGKINKVKVFSPTFGTYNVDDFGFAMLYMDELPVACGSNERRVGITTDHPLFEAVLSTALTAKATRSDVVLGYIDSCSIKNNAWDFSVLDLN